MASLLVIMLGMAASGQEVEGHARHWRNYLNGLLAQLAQEANGSSSESPHLLRFMDILNSHGARYVRVDSPQPPLLCRCSPAKNGGGNASSDVVMAELMTTSTTSTTTSTTTSRLPPLLLVVPGLIVAPRDEPFAIVLYNKTPNASDSGTKVASSATSTSTPVPTVKLRRRRLRFVLVLVAFVVALSASLAYYMRSYLAKYKREFEIIRNAQFL